MYYNTISIECFCFRSLAFKYLCIAFRVRQNLDKDFILIDPDPGKAYTRAKKARCRFCSGEEQLRNPESQEPEALVTDTDVDVEESWSTDTSVLPKRFSYLNIVEHAKKSGREAKSYVEKPLEKGYKFFYENYCHDVLCKLEENEIHVKGKCFRSQKKNERPHNVTVILLTTGDVKRAKCSCPAGANGYCNHTMGLLYLIDHVIKLKAPEFPRIGTCTDNPQQWHKPRTQGINPEPIMGYNVINPKYRDKSSEGLKCTFYEARQPMVQNNEGANNLFDSLKSINPSLGFCTVFEQKPATIPTNLNGHMVPCGSVLSYQLSLTEANFNVLTNFPVLQRPRAVGDYFPDLPIETNVPAGVGLQMPLSYQEDRFISHLNVPNPSLIERETRGQSNNPLWFQSRRLRLTSSNFGLVCNRKLNISQTKFVQKNLLSPKDLSNVPSIRYGISNEAKAANKYAEYMTGIGHDVQVLECGLVVSSTMPWLAASPDRKVIDKIFGFGLVEIKCPYSLRHLTPEEACADPSFYCQLVNGKPELKKDHPYYYQVQGQMGLAGLKWCDFVVFFQKGLIVQRIKFDEPFWKSMITKLTNFYQQHVMPEAMKV